MVRGSTELRLVLINREYSICLLRNVYCRSSFRTKLLLSAWESFVRPSHGGLPRGEGHQPSAFFAVRTYWLSKQLAPLEVFTS